MKQTLHLSVLIFASVVASQNNQAQPFDITTFDPTLAGPWSEVGRTTLMVPKVANGSVTLDGVATSQEYGGFTEVTVTPGVNAWILDYPGDRTWDDEADSSFNYWLAHDDDYLYVGVSAKDEVVTSDDPNVDFWKDDSIEIVVDALADRFDNDTDASKDPVGGHSYINFAGRFSEWDEAANAISTRERWATAVPWTYGATGDVFGSGKAVAGGWQMEVRFKKRLFEDATAGNKLRNGYRMGFNIGFDDDDKRGPGVDGDKSRTEDLEIQYFWANRQRRKGYTAEYLAALTPEERASKLHFDNLELGIDSAGRLSHGGAGEILFGYDQASKATGTILFVTSNADSPINGDPALIALLRAKGYTVTVFTSGVPPEDLQAAAAGKNLVLISETIGSTSVLDPVGDVVGVFSLKDTDVPIISFEPYMYDNAEWTARGVDGANDWINFGNTSRSEVPEEIQDTRDSLHIRMPAHPIVAGFTGAVKVYNILYSLNWGVPSADADIVASAQPDGSYPTIFVYEKGDKLVDGSTVPNKRIGLFVGQAAAPNANTPLDYADLTEAGRTLFLNTVAYAVGTTQQPTPTLSVARAGNNLVLTYASGTLQSANALPATWTDESGASSPLTVTPTAAAKFYRVRSN